MASKTIKGLTVEIGGDTTKLGKALKDVEARSSALSKELGDVNKLLKMDPGNADLLAQKQKILAQAVSNTRQKLDALKEAEKQVQKQFERGEVSEEQVRALQREIVATENKMKGYEKAVKETAEAVEKLGDKSGDVQKGTKKAKKGSEDAEKGFEDMADAADKAGDASDGLGGKLGGLAKGGLKALAVGVTAAIGALIGSAEASREYRTEMGKLDTAFTKAGHSSEAAKETYQALQGVLGETEQAVEAANHLAMLTDNEQDLQKWTDICTGVYATFGASLPIEGLTEAANETAKTGALTGALADALNWAGVNEEKFQAQLDACSTEQERQALITETLNGLYSETADAYREANAEVIRANEANEAWAAAMAEVGGAVEPLLTDIKLLGASLLSDLVPGVKEVTGAFREMLNGNEEAAANLGEALSGIFSQLLNKITDILPQVTEIAVSLVTTLATSIIQALPQLLSTFVQVGLSVISGLTTAIPQIVAAWQTIIPQLTQALVTGIPQLIQGAVQLLLAIVQAIPQIIPPLILAIPQIVTAIVEGLVIALPQLIEGAIQFLMAIVQAVPQVIPPLVEAIPPLITTLVDALLVAIPQLLEGALLLFGAIIDAIPLLIPPLVEAIPQIITTLVDGLIIAIPQVIEGAVQLLNAIIDAIPILIELLIPEIPGIVTTLVTELLRLTPVLLDAAIDLLMAIILAIPEIVAMIIVEAPMILDAFFDILNELPRLIGGIFSQVLEKLGGFLSPMINKAGEIGRGVLNKISEFFRQLPGKIWNFLTSAVSKITKFGSDAKAKAKTAASDIYNAVVNGIKGLPDKIKTIGSDLVKGLWNGINDMVDWVTGKIEGFGGDVLGGIKNFFGINSPSRVFKDEVGKMLAVGLAEGIEDNANKPLDAMTDLSNGILGEAGEINGLTLERRLQHTFADPSIPTTETGMLDKLDKILVAIKQGQVIALDGDKLVGGTVTRTDAALGQRRVLVTRGAV